MAIYIVQMFYLTIKLEGFVEWLNDVQWNLCIIDTLGPTKSGQGVLIFQVSVTFGTITMCVDYAGFLIFKCPD